jgi:hypothetical protein
MSLLTIKTFFFVQIIKGKRVKKKKKKRGGKKKEKKFIFIVS